MQKFLKKIFLMGLVFFLLMEVSSRILLDPWHEYSLNTFNEKQGLGIKEVYFGEETKHVDYLFIGSSRIPTLIDQVLLKELSGGKVVINAGRGGMTPGIHYQALEHKLKEYPDYLNGSKVFLEHTSSQNYCDPFEDDYMLIFQLAMDEDRPMSQLLVPHLDMTSFSSFILESKNELRIKMDVSMLYFFSSYRTSQLFNERFNAYNKQVFNTKREDLVNEGGIRNDNRDELKKAAINSSKRKRKQILESPPLTKQGIEESSFAKIYSLVEENGGELVLFNVPLPTNQSNIYKTERARENGEVFHKWINEKGIEVLNVKNFEYDDSDFPDYWHLGRNRRAEFTKALFTEIKTLK